MEEESQVFWDDDEDAPEEDHKEQPASGEYKREPVDAHAAKFSDEHEEKPEPEYDDRQEFAEEDDQQDPDSTVDIRISNDDGLT